MKNKSDIRDMLFNLDQTRKKMLQPRLLELGLTLGQGQPRILRSLYRREDVTQKELADDCRLDVTTLSRALDYMEKGGFLFRRRDPDCRRSYRILLTEKGKETARQVLAAFDEMDDKIWQGFTEAEMDSLLEGLQKIARNLEGGCES